MRRVTFEFLFNMNLESFDDHLPLGERVLYVLIRA